MRYPSASIILAIVVSVQSFHGALAKATISFYPDDFKEGLSFKIGEEMDTCNGPEYHNTVQLSQMGLDNVREDFVDSVNVRSIVLEGNRISRISPDAFRSVPNLSCLNIRDNQMFLSDLFVLNHANLLKLNLAKSRIFSGRSKWIVSLPRLTHLDLRDSNIRNLPQDFRSSFPSLTHFYFSGNEFRSNIFDYLPPSTQNVYIERSMTAVNMIDVPFNISALYLKKSNIYWRRQIKLSNLKILSMRECIMKYIPIDANNLLDLDLASNDISDLDRYMFTNMSSLRRLSLDNNSLSSFDVIDDISSLTDLSLNFNKIENITLQSIAGLKNLKGLYLRGNRITMIEAMAFSEFKHLEKLDLAENRLTTLPYSWMATLNGLLHLDLRSNLFAAFEDMSVNLFLNLRHVFVGKNNFTQIYLPSLVNTGKNVIIHVS